MSQLTYNPERDTFISLYDQWEVQNRTFEVSAVTMAGQSLPNAEPKPNEDAFSVIGYEFGIAAAVFDGASSQQPIPELSGQSGARFASHTLKQLFEAQTITHITDPKILLSGLNRTIGQRYQSFPSVDYGDLNSLPSSTATVALINTDTNKLDFSHVGDSFGAALYVDGRTELLTNDLHRPFDEQVLQLILDIARKEGITPREARNNSLIRTALMEMFQDTRNRPDGTGEGIVNGDSNMDRYIHLASVPLKDVKAVLLGSDGLVPAGLDERQEDTRKLMFDVARSDGREGLVHYTRKTLDEDPDRWKVRYKHADDATGVLITLA